MCLFRYAAAAWLAVAALAGVQPLRVPPDIQERRLILRVPPIYPREAREARIEGTVRLAAWIGANGEVQRLRLVSGHPYLARAALDAVARWRYRPVFRAGVRVPVVTIIEVTFNLRERPARHSSPVA